MMESGIISASHGRIPLDHGNCFEMVRLSLLTKVSKQVNSSFSNGPYNSINCLVCVTANTVNKRGRNDETAWIPQNSKID